MSAAAERRAVRLREQAALCDRAVQDFTGEYQRLVRLALPLEVALYAAVGYALRMSVFASTTPSMAKAVALALQKARHDAEKTALAESEQVPA